MVGLSSVVPRELLSGALRNKYKAEGLPKSKIKNLRSSA